MPINIDWLGDGWTYYPDDERKAMDAALNGEDRPLDPTDFKKVFLPEDEGVRLEMAFTAAVSMDCMVIPIELAKMLAAGVRAGNVPKFALEMLEKCAERAETAVRVSKEFNNYRNN